MGKKTLTRLAAAAAGGALALGMAAPAFAGHTEEIPINPLNDTGTTAEDFSPQICDGLLAQTGPDEDGWQFNAAGFTGEPEDIKWFLKLEDAEGNPVTVTNENLDDFQHEIIKPNNVVQLRIITPGGLFLLNESSIKVPKEKADNVQFVLSHTCPGVPDDNDEKDDVKKIIKKIVIEGDVHIDKSVNIDVHIEKIIIELKKKGVDLDHDDLKKIIKKIIEDERKKDDGKKKDVKDDDVKDDDVKDDDKKLADTGSPVLGMTAMGGLLLAVGAAAMLGIRRRRLHFVDADE